MKTYKLTIVQIHPYGDGVTYMFIDGQYYICGNYHDKIKRIIFGFIKGLEFAGHKVNVEYMRWEPKNEVEDYHSVLPDCDAPTLQEFTEALAKGCTHVY